MGDCIEDALLNYQSEYNDNGAYQKFLNLRVLIIGNADINRTLVENYAKRVDASHKP